jgi:hypothetical protein
MDFVPAHGVVVIHRHGGTLDLAAVAAILVVIENDLLIEVVETAHVSFQS